MTLVLIPPGTYYLGAYEVTQAEYSAIMNANPSHFRGSGRLPVETVTWLDTIRFCNRLGEKEGLRPYYQISGQDATTLGGDGYRLPTRQEWEDACRAGRRTKYHFGNDPSAVLDFDWIHANAQARTHPVGLKRPSVWGLYDLHGNVCEWCFDREEGDHIIKGGSIIRAAQDAGTFLNDRHPRGGDT